MSWKEAEELIKTGKILRRSWWPCKVIRKYSDADADYFYNEFNTDNAIVEDCEKRCDCKVGIYAPEAGDAEATDWEEVK